MPRHTSLLSFCAVNQIAMLRTIDLCHCV